MIKDGHSCKFRYGLLDKEYISRIYLRQVISRLRPDYEMVSEGDCITNIHETIVHHPDFIITGAIFSDGVALMEYKRLNCRIPLIVYTRYRNQIDKTDGLNVVHYALKPVSETEVEMSLSRMEQYLNRRIEHNQNL